MRRVGLALWLLGLVAAASVVGAGVASLRVLDHVGAALLVTSGMTALTSLLRLASVVGARQ